MRKYRETDSLNQALIICGGKGTRLWPLTKNTPKPLIKINNKPFIDYLIKNLSRQNIKKIILICCFKFNEFKKKYHNKNIHGIHIQCFNEKTPKGTGGGIKLIQNKLDNYFLVINGDTFFDINIHSLFEVLKKNKYYGIIATTNKNNKRFGYLFRKNNQNYVNAGTYIFSKKIFRLFQNKKEISLENDVFPIGIKKKKIQFQRYNDQNKFIDIGVHKDLKKTPLFLKKIFYRPALFLDRDGVINKDLGYVHKIKDFKWLKGSKKIIKYFNEKLYHVIVLTNQSGVGRGYYETKDVENLHNWINKSLNINGSFIDKFYYSPYFKDSKNFGHKKYFKLRKPNDGMIKKACKEFNINMKKSLFIGDQQSDLILAKKCKIKYFMAKKNNLSSLFKSLKKKY